MTLLLKDCQGPVTLPSPSLLEVNVFLYRFRCILLEPLTVEKVQTNTLMSGFTDASEPFILFNPFDLFFKKLGSFYLNQNTTRTKKENVKMKVYLCFLFLNRGETPFLLSRSRFVFSTVSRSTPSTRCPVPPLTPSCLSCVGWISFIDSKSSWPSTVRPSVLVVNF